VRSTFGMSRSNWTTGNYATGTSVLTQNHSLSIASGTSAKSADFHVAASSMGSFVPDGYSRDVMATASGRMVGTTSTLSGTARLFVERAGTPISTFSTRAPSPPNDSTGPQSVAQYTLGATGTTLVDRNWTMSFVAGVDGYRLRNVQAASFTPVQSLLDSALHAAEGGADRATMRVSSVYRINASAPTNASLTFSLEHATLRVSSLAPPLRTFETETESDHGGGSGPDNSGKGNQNDAPLGPVTATSTSTQRVVSWQNSTGLVAQTNVAVKNTFFLTGGVRFEHDSRLVGVDQIETLPMVGASIVGEHGPLTVKLRSAYGEGFRPPTTPSRLQFWETHDARVITQNPLGPERQSGVESGIDLFFRRALALQVTRFDQRASGLIELVGIAPENARRPRDLIPVAQNVGQISNRGWELQGTANYGRVSFSGTMSFVDSRVQKVAAGYTGDLIAGDRMLQVPAQTQSLGVTWNALRWRATIGASRALDWIYYDQQRLAAAADTAGVPGVDLTGPRLRQYWKHYDGGARLRASASRDFREMLTFEISAENLLNYQTGEPDDGTIIPGRTLMTGVRVRF
jgi:iron complex outermembrane receptor protein